MRERAPVGAPIPAQKSQGDMIMAPTPTENGPKKSRNRAAEAVQFVEESLSDSMPITSTALSVQRESPSAPHATTLLLCLLVQAVESLKVELAGVSCDITSVADSMDTLTRRVSYLANEAGFTDNE